MERERLEAESWRPSGTSRLKNILLKRSSSIQAYGRRASGRHAATSEDTSPDKSVVNTTASQEDPLGTIATPPENQGLTTDQGLITLDKKQSDDIEQPDDIEQSDDIEQPAAESWPTAVKRTSAHSTDAMAGRTEPRLTGGRLAPQEPAARQNTESMLFV